MKTIRNTLCSLLLAGALALITSPQQGAANAQLAAPMPDLKITSVSENGMTAWVTVKNVGSGKAAACWLQVWHLNNGSWLATATKSVTSLAPGAQVTIVVQAAGIAAAFNCFKVDSTNLITESKESNNTLYIPYGPEG